MSVTLDAVQEAWLDALADLHESSRQDVLREGLRYLAAREHARMAREQRLQAVREANLLHPGGRELLGGRQR